MKLFPENLNYRSWIVMGAGIWSGLMLLFVLTTGVTDFGLSDTGLYVFERVYAVAAIILGVHVSARYNTVEKVPVTSSE